MDPSCARSEISAVDRVLIDAWGLLPDSQPCTPCCHRSLHVDDIVVVAPKGVASSRMAIKATLERALEGDGFGPARVAHFHPADELHSPLLRDEEIDDAYARVRAETGIEGELRVYRTHYHRARH